MNPLRNLPSVEKLLSLSPLSELPHDLAVRAARHVLEETRQELREQGDSFTPSHSDLADRAGLLAEKAGRVQLRRIINATGVVLHTNLGRSTLASSAVRAVVEVAAGHAALETDEVSGGRGDRYAHVASLLCELTGAEDALVVNNNAAATILPIAAIAAGREVILSRGQMVEIGGQFRLPDVIVQAGAKLIEVGTTNRTRIADYERAINQNTGMILRCHPSNYKIIGFTEEASLAELVELGRRTGVCVGDDIGSGAMVDFAPYGLTEEPMVKESVATGADVVWFSGDKLLGGPQAGILLGKSRYIAPLKKHPLTRALRPDKLTLAALEATLRLYITGRAWQEIPTLRRIVRSPEDVRTACEQLQTMIFTLRPVFDWETVPTLAEVGGGSLPGLTLPSFAVAIKHPTFGATELARRLRKLPVAVYGRIEKDRLLLDMRAVDESEEMEIFAALQSVSLD